MSRKTQHTRFEDKILRKLANEDKPQVVTAWSEQMVGGLDLRMGVEIASAPVSTKRHTVEHPCSYYFKKRQKWGKQILGLISQQQKTGPLFGYLLHNFWQFLTI